MLANSTTMGLLALYFCIVLGYEYSKIIQVEENLDLTPINGALLGVFATLMSIPQLVFDGGKMTRMNDVEEGLINGWFRHDATNDFVLGNLSHRTHYCFF